MNLKAKHFAIKRKRLNLKDDFVATLKHIVPYTLLPQHIRRFETREEAAKELMNENEIIVDLRHEK